MKRFVFLLALAGVTVVPHLAAQAPSHPDELKKLRQILADQKNNPDKVIRTPTNPPPARSEATHTNAATAPAGIPVFKPEPPRAEPLSTKAAAAAALERQFLEGRLSERQYTKALADLERANKAEPKSKATAPAGSQKTPARGPAPPTGQAAPAPTSKTIKQQKVSEVETKLDEMIRQKEARERAAQTNAAPTAMPTGTKRQRLDFLLKQVVEGKITDEEYKKQREKILAEPE